MPQLTISPLHEYCGRITAPLDDWDKIKKLFKDYKDKSGLAAPIILTGACFEKGKLNENPHYHLLFKAQFKDSYLRKNFFSVHFPKKYSIKYLEIDKLPEMQRYMSKKEFSGDQILLANWDTTKANKEYWIQNDKLQRSCKTITDKLVYYYQHKFKNFITDAEYAEINSEKYHGSHISRQDIDIWTSCNEYFSTNGKLIPLDYDMKKYIRTINMKLCPDDSYMKQLRKDFFRDF